VRPGSFTIFIVLLCAHSTRADDVAYALDQGRPTGVWLSADVGAGAVAGDLVLVPSIGAGFETEPFGFHLRAPLALRAWDFAPQAPRDPAGCEHIRCEEWVDAEGGLSPVALSRLLSEARLFRPGDVFHARAGGLLMTLGHGEVVRRYTNAAEWDRRRSGAYAEANLPWGRTQVQAFSASALYPADLFGARLALSPLHDAQAEGVLARLLSRLRVGVEGAADVLTPARDDSRGLSAGTRPVVASAVDVTWPLLDEPGSLQVSPFLSSSVVRGLAGAEDFPAVGAAAGLDASLDFIVVAMRAGARVSVHQRGHRSAPFSTLWDVDRRRMIAASSASRALLPVGAADIGNPGGMGGALDAEVLVLRTVRAIARVSLSPTVETNEAELGVDFGAGGVLVGARLLERGFTAPQDIIAWNERTFFVLEGTWAVFPPFSAFVRAQHALRFHDDVRGLSADDDVVIGASFDLVLSGT
jgi:hypothetical protein